MYLNLDLLYNIADYIFKALAIVTNSEKDYKIIYLWTECKNNTWIYWNLTFFCFNIDKSYCKNFKTDYNFKVVKNPNIKSEWIDSSFRKFGLQL